MVYTTYSCCFHHKIKTPKYIWFIICINTNTGDLHANLFSIYLPYGVNGASWCLSMPAMVLPGTMEIASLRSLAEMMESDVWTLKLNWMSQVLVSWQVCFQVSVFFAAQTRWCPSWGHAYCLPGLQGSQWKELWQMLQDGISILQHLPQLPSSFGPGESERCRFFVFNCPFQTWHHWRALPTGIYTAMGI